MQRPLYESADDREAEADFCDALALRWGVTMRKLPPQYGIDRLCFRGTEDAVCALEVKCLNKTSEKCEFYGDTYLNLEKYQCLRGFVMLGLPAVYAVRLMDGDFYHKVHTNEEYAIRFVGRSDRDDPLDVKPVVRLPWSSFKRIGET